MKMKIFDIPKLDPLKINLGTKDELEISGFTPDRNKKILTAILCVLSGGLLLLLLSWKPSIRLKFTHLPCQSRDAKVLLVKDIYGQIWEEEVTEEAVVVDEQTYTKRKYFYNKKIKYLWDEDCATFLRVSYPPEGTLLSGLQNRTDGLTATDAEHRKRNFGENLIDIETPTVWQLFISQAFNPFYIFQAYTIIIWCLQTYFIYSGCIFFLSVTSIVMNIWETRRQTKVLREKMTTQSQVQVLRDGSITVLHSAELVPGDVVIVVACKELLEADMVLLDGSVIMNEAILTGESVPVTKVHVPSNDDEPFDAESHKPHILHGGTQVLQVRGGAQLRALVVKTGFDTVKGEMIRSILFPKPMDFHIYSDFLKLIFFFIILGLSAAIWSLFNWSKNSLVSWPIVLYNSLDLLTFVVPPIIPATITAINLWAQKRLQKQQIFCLSSNYISLAGPTDIVCFDKTGTLTEDDLSLEGVVPCNDGEFQAPVQNLKTLPTCSPLCRTLASCHSVAISDDGQFIGHPLDIKIFCALDWTITTEPQSKMKTEAQPLFYVSPRNSGPSSKTECAILKTFPFASADQRMTVICQRAESDNYEVFVKGAPERIASLCRKITVPESMDAVLAWYTRQGLRVIAAAYASIPAQWNQISDTAREVLESDATFLGLIILQNRLKIETLPALEILHNASVTTVMITGDNMLTAASVARQCGLVKPDQQLIFVKALYVASSVKAVQHLQIVYYDSQCGSQIYTKSKLKSVVHSDFVFGIDGDSFQLISQFDQETFKKLIHRGKVFSRMKPDQKIEVIEALQKLGHQVAMCGDGCNDCGALKAAHAGISLSSTEASVAAPFTSLQQDIGCVINLIREGRATLISTFASFKYNISYCFSALIVVIFMFTVYTEPSDTQYLIMDLVLITVPSLVLGNTGASSKLSPKRPSRRVIHPIHIISILSFLGIQTLMYWLTWEYMESQAWYERYNLTSDGSVHEDSYERTVLILDVFYSILIGALIFSHGYPFRKPIYTNKILFVYLICATTFCIFLTFCEAAPILSFMNFIHIPYTGFRGTMLLIVILTAILCYIWEQWILYGVVDNRLIPWLLNCWGPRHLYEKLEEDIRSSVPQWPKLTDYSTYSPDAQRKDGEKNRQTGLIMEAYEEPSDKLFRKFTKHRFKADVKYVDEMERPKTNKIIFRTSFSDQSGEPPAADKDGSAADTVEADYGYAEPVRETLGSNLTSSFANQNNFHSQLYKGKSKEAFTTFQRSLQKNVPDSRVAEPYEVIPLKYAEGSPEQNENIYSLIQDGTVDVVDGESISTHDNSGDQVTLDSCKSDDGDYQTPSPPTIEDIAKAL